MYNKYHAQSIEVVVELYNKREMLTVLSNYIGNCLCLQKEDALKLHARAKIEKHLPAPDPQWLQLPYRWDILSTSSAITHIWCDTNEARVTTEQLAPKTLWWAHKCDLPCSQIHLSWNLTPPPCGAHETLTGPFDLPDVYQSTTINKENRQKTT